jgi:SAM-dependent methyltransferase
VATPNDSEPPIAETWAAGKPHELAFWRMVATGAPPCPPEYHAEILGRCDPAAEVNPAFIADIVTAPLAEAVLVDIAAGPVSALGWNHRGQRLNVIPIDALAADYATIMAEAGLQVPVPTRPGHAEALTEHFAPASVDFAHMRNALDHCYDPLKVIRGAMVVLKPGASFRISTVRNEAVRENYEGFHQWNIDAPAGRLVIWRPGVEIDVAAAVPEAEISIEGDESWLYLRLRRQG